MTSLTSSLKFRAVFWLVILALSAARADKICRDGAHPGAADEPCLCANGQESGGRKLLRGPHSPKRRDLSTAPNLANRRSLLAAMCSDNDNSDEAVISCTNAVRIDPTAFDFPCGYGWASQYPKATKLFKNSVLSNSALEHSKDQASRGTLSHTGVDGSSVGDRASREGYSWNGISENIAFGYTSAKSVVFGWICSPGHRRNIMSCDTMHIGVGIFEGRDKRPYHTQVFGCPRGTRCSCSGGQDDPAASSPVYGGGPRSSSPVYGGGPRSSSPVYGGGPRPGATASPKPYRSTGPYFFTGDDGRPITFFGYGPQDGKTKRSPSPSSYPYRYPSPSPSPQGTAVYTETDYPSATATATATGTGSNGGGSGSNPDDFFGGFGWGFNG